MHKSRIASHVGGQYRRQPAIDPDWPLLLHGPQSNPNVIVRRIRRQRQTRFDGMPTQADVGYWQIVLQKSKNGLRLIFREKASQATIADRCALKRATEVAGEFIASCCSPPHDYSIAAPTARKNCVQ
jgi:hypothetical protein